MARAPWLVALSAAFIAAGATIVLLRAPPRDDVVLEPPAAGRPLTDAEQRETQVIASAAFHHARALLPGLPPRLLLMVRWGKDVTPETGETGTNSLPAQIMFTIDPDRDALGVIRTWLRAMMLHELHHLARKAHAASAGGSMADGLVDRAVTEGLATAFERDFAKVDPPWGQAPPEVREWTRELLGQPDDSDRQTWLVRHPDGRRWIAMRVGTFLVDEASRRSGRSAADLVFASTSEILALANVR
jgi:hypothetical protein